MSPAEPAVLDDLAVAIEPDGSGGLRLEVLQPLGGGEAPFEPPFSRDELRRLLSELERRVRHLQAVDQPRPPRDPAPGDSGRFLENIGRRLFESLAVGEVGRSLFTALGRIHDRTSRGLRLRLVFDPEDHTVAEIAALPWELLFDPGHHRFLARSPEIAVVRFLPVSTARRLRPGQLPLRVLVAVANPRDLRALEAEEEADAIWKAYAELDEGVRVEIVEAASPMALLRRLREGCFHVLHFIGHGDFEVQTGEGRVYFGSADEPATPVSGDTLASMLDGLAELRLVVLNACETARSDRREGGDPFAGVAHALVRGGLPAVVAMQLPISDRAALAFSRALYPALAEGLPVDLAVARGRQAIRVACEDFEWAVPALFLQVEDGRIFDLRPPPRQWGKGLLRAAAMVLILAAGYGLWRWLDPGFPYRAWLNPPDCPSPVALGRDAAMRFVRIQPGAFRMGSTDGDPDERPRHRVAIEEPFCLGMFEVTRRQWQQVMEGSGDEAEEASTPNPELPVARVNLYEAWEFVARLNAQEGAVVFRLPTEAEWEYATRAGTTTAYSFGDDPADLPRYGNCRSPEQGPFDGSDRTAPVGSFEPNLWGLYDLHGNVQEWVAGNYDAYPGADPSSLAADLEDAPRRGGSFDSDPERCRSAARNPFAPGRNDLRNGLRIVREIR